MIFDAILTVLVAVFNGVLGLIPSWDPDISGFVLSMSNGFVGLSAIFPVGTLAICLGIVLTTYVFLFTVTTLAWLWAKVPFTFK